MSEAPMSREEAGPERIGPQEALEELRDLARTARKRLAFNAAYNAGRFDRVPLPSDGKDETGVTAREYIDAWEESERHVIKLCEAVAAFRSPVPEEAGPERIGPERDYSTGPIEGEYVWFDRDEFCRTPSWEIRYGTRDELREKRGWLIARAWSAEAAAKIAAAFRSPVPEPADRILRLIEARATKARSEVAQFGIKNPGSPVMVEASVLEGLAREIRDLPCVPEPIGPTITPDALHAKLSEYWEIWPLGTPKAEAFEDPFDFICHETIKARVKRDAPPVPELTRNWDEFEDELEAVRTTERVGGDVHPDRPYRYRLYAIRRDSGIKVRLGLHYLHEATRQMERAERAESELAALRVPEPEEK